MINFHTVFIATLSIENLVDRYLKLELAKQATYRFCQLLPYIFFSFYETQLPSYRFICQNWLKNYTSVKIFLFFNYIFLKV